MLEQERLLALRYHVPRVAGPLVERPRLHALLQGDLRQKLTLVSAPAGFGKTTLVAAWVSGQEPGPARVAWVSLDASDNTPLRFWRYVLTALDQCLPGRGAGALAALERPAQPPLEDVLTLLVNALVQEEQRAVLILDDYQHIADPVINRALAFLLEHLPAALHVMLLTRAEPALPLARLRASRQVNDIGMDALRCTVDEARAFLDGVVGRTLEANVVRELNDRTEGWLVGLQLLALSLQGRREAGALLEELRGSQRYVFDYLMDEVLRQQPAAIQQFLLASSVLERLSGPLCDALLEREDSHALLQTLEHDRLFLIALDEGRVWYRYHTLFREALLTRLTQQGEEAVRSLHRRASDWFSAQGDAFPAVSHALKAGDWERAATLLAAIPFAQLSDPASAQTLSGWFGQLPASLIYSRPRLWLPYVNLLSFNAPDRAADTWLQGLEERLRAQAGLGAALDLPPDQRTFLLGYVVANRASIAGIFGDAPRARAFARDALTLLPEDRHFERFMAVTAESTAALIDGDLPQAHALVREAAALAQQVGQQLAALTLRSIAAMYLHRQGQLHGAWDALAQALAQVMRPDEPPSVMASFSYTLQAHLLLEWNELDEALRLVWQGIRLAEQGGYGVAAEQGYSILAPILLARGEYEGARAALGQSMRMPLHRDNLFTQAMWFTPVQVRLWLATGQRAPALAWANELDRGPRPASVFGREVQDIARARVMLAAHQPERALDLLGRLLPDAERHGRGDHVLEMLLLEALAQHQLGEDGAALNALARAVVQGGPQGYRRRFLDEGPVMAELLGRLRGRAGISSASLQTLLAAFGGASPSPAPPDRDTRLSARETEVLALLARGLSNGDIARRLGVSTHTVKSHVGNLLSKLEARNRTQAVARARALGLLGQDV